MLVFNQCLKIVFCNIERPICIFRPFVSNFTVIMFSVSCRVRTALNVGWLIKVLFTDYVSQGKCSPFYDFGIFDDST
jgi:hypothetical protein